MIDIPDSILPVNKNGERVCPQCQRTVSQCTCPAFDPPQRKDLCVRMKLAKKGRHGKTVTMIEGLPANLDYVKALAKRLKQKCGSGGTYALKGAEAWIEIQGNNIEKVRQLLSSEDFNVQ
ncbi:MAG: translation initiation factor [Candidatus Omnitrophica bacterium]|nr:translation initiation factor [Candidatus Omnitrophota bacterium]